MLLFCFAIALGVVMDSMAQARPPQILEVSRDYLKPDAIAANRKLEKHAEDLCRTLGFTHPYLTIESVSGPAEMWYLNGFDSEAEVEKLRREYQQNTKLGSVQESGEMRILRGFLKGAHLSRTTGSQIHPVRNATKSRACYGNDAPRAGKRHTACKVLAAPSELGNPHRTRVPTFPQQRLPRRTNLPKLQNPPKSLGLTDSGAELEIIGGSERHNSAKGAA
jgi:hypothetical protein